MKGSTLLVGTAAALLLCGAAPSRGDYISWGYAWTPNKPVIHADSPGPGKIFLTSESVDNVIGSTNVVATNISTFSVATGHNAAHQDTFTNAGYALTLTLTDNASHQSGSLVFTGLFNGTLSVASANITNTFTGSTTQAITLGGNDYTVTIGPYSPPGPPGSTNRGSISAYASVVASEHNPPGNTPEPSTLALGCLGIPLLGLVAARRRCRGARAGA
jgi:hypothetical protein